MTARTTRIGIVGAGGIGRTHASHWADIDGAVVTAICDPIAESAEALAAAVSEQTGHKPEVYGDLAALLAAKSVDAISLCTPPNDHATAAAAALGQQVAVLCEKPPTRTGSELEELVRVVGEGALLQFGMCHVFHPGLLQAADLIRAGRIGEVVHLNVRFAFRFPGLADRWFSDPEVAGGGIILDTLVHSISIARALLGEPRSVSAHVHTATPGVSVEDSAVLVLQTESGAVATLQASWATPAGGAIVDIHGTEGQIVIDYGEDAPRHRIGTDPEWQHGEPSAEDRFHGQARSFLAALESGRVDDNTITDARAVMRVIDAAYASVAERGSAVRLDS